MIFIILITFIFFVICRKIRIWCTLYKIKKFINLWRYGCDTLRHFNLNIFVAIKKRSLILWLKQYRNFSLILFQKIVLDLPVTNRSLLLKRLEKKLEKDAKQNYNAAFSHLKKKQFHFPEKFLFLVTKKESENKKLPSKWTSFASLLFSLLRSIPMCPILKAFFKLIKYCLSSSAFICVTSFINSFL